MSCSGPCIIAGNAWNLHEDLEAARAIFGDVPVIAVNGAAREVKAFALYSRHPTRFTEPSFRWEQHQRRLFHDEFTTHSYIEPADYVWPDTGGMGGSAWGARKLAWLMGFDPVILCGCPLEIGGYTNFRPGVMMSKQYVIDGLRNGIVSEPEWFDGVYSMSGWTKSFLGVIK